MITKRRGNKIPVRLTDHEKYQVACQLMNGDHPKIIADLWNISVSYVCNIKYEMLEVVTVWKPGVLDKFKGSPVEPVQPFKFPRATTLAGTTK